MDIYEAWSWFEEHEDESLITATTMIPGVGSWLGVGRGVWNVSHGTGTRSDLEFAMAGLAIGEGLMALGYYTGPSHWVRQQMSYWAWRSKPGQFVIHRAVVPVLTSPATAIAAVPAVATISAWQYEQRVNEPIRKSHPGSSGTWYGSFARGSWFGPFASGFGTVV